MMTTTMSTTDRIFLLRKKLRRYRRLVIIVIYVLDIFMFIFRRFVRSERTVMESKSEEKTWSGFPILALDQFQHTGNLKFFKN